MSKDVGELTTTIYQWAEALGNRPSDPGYTVAELAKIFNKGATATRARLKKAISSGKCKQGWRPTRDCLGRSILVPVYQLVEEK